MKLSPEERSTRRREAQEKRERDDRAANQTRFRLVHYQPPEYTKQDSCWYLFDKKSDSCRSYMNTPAPPLAIFQDEDAAREVMLAILWADECPLPDNIEALCDRHVDIVDSVIK